MNYQTILLIAIFAAIIHVLEEYLCGWLSWVHQFAPDFKLKHFVVLNMLFISLCFLGALIAERSILISSSILALFLINALIHILTTIKFKKYSPGLLSSLLLLMPISLYGYYHLLINEVLNVRLFSISFVLGFSCMAIPFIFRLYFCVKSQKINRDASMDV